MAFITSVVGVPIDCSGRMAGCERAPQALRDAGLTARLNVPDHGDLAVAINDPARDPLTGIIAFEQLFAVSEEIRAEIADLLRSGERPLVVGGSCELLIGIAAALREVYGRAGLAFIDGHIDYYDGASSATGEAADMELAILTGIGPSRLTGLAGESPLMYPADVTAFGVRDLAAARADGAPDPHPAIRIYEAETLLSSGDILDEGRQTAARFAADPGRFWLHLDFDVLNTASMPAVDYPMDGGLDWAQLRQLVRPLAESPALLGMDITIYNPALDPDGSSAARIVDFLADVLA